MGRVCHASGYGSAGGASQLSQLIEIVFDLPGVSAVGYQTNEKSPLLAFGDCQAWCVCAKFFFEGSDQFFKIFFLSFAHRIRWQNLPEPTLFVTTWQEMGYMHAIGQLAMFATRARKGSNLVYRNLRQKIESMSGKALQIFF